MVNLVLVVSGRYVSVYKSRSRSGNGLRLDHILLNLTPDG
jgi:hypothetical protein